MSAKEFDHAAFAEEVTAKYPAKVARKRKKAIVANDPKNVPEVQANVRTIPGIISQRGCSYAGCKGRSSWTYQGYRKYYPRSNRLRILLLAYPAESDFPRWSGRFELHTLLFFNGYAGFEHRIRRVRSCCARLFRRPMTCFIPRELPFSPPVL